MSSSESRLSVSARRTQRVTLSIPLLVVSENPDFEFRETCHTRDVNAHGCSLLSPKAIDPGTQLRLQVPNGKQSALARVVSCRAEKEGAWHLGVELEVPAIFWRTWGVTFPGFEAEAGQQPAKLEPAGETPAAAAVPSAAPPPPEATSGQSAVPALAPTESELKATPQPEKQQAPVQPADPVPQPMPPVVVEPQGDLAEQARRISTQFEEEYRERLGELLLRLRADFEATALEDWNRWRTAARLSFQEKAEETTQRLLHELEDKRREMGLHEGLPVLLERARALQASLEIVPEKIAEGILPARDQALHRVREEMADFARELRSNLDQEKAQLDQTLSETRSHAEEANRTREYVESLARILPDKLEQRVWESVDARLEGARKEMENGVMNRLTAHAAYLEQRLGTQLSTELRQKLLDDLDRHEQQFLDLVGVRLEETRGAQERLRASFSQTKAELVRQSEIWITQVRSQCEAALEQHKDLSTELKQLDAQLRIASRTALHKLGRDLWDELRQTMDADFERRGSHLRHLTENLHAETARLESMALQIHSELEGKLQVQMEDMIAAATSQARSRFERQLEELRQRETAKVEEQERSSFEAMETQHNALMKDFQEGLDTLTHDYLERWQAAVKKSLSAIPEILNHGLNGKTGNEGS